VATVLWLLATLGFKYYVVNLGAYTESYGALGAVMVLLLWFYLSGFAILIVREARCIRLQCSKVVLKDISALIVIRA